MSKLIMAAIVSACFAFEAPDAAAENNPSVTGGFTSRVDRGALALIRTVQLHVVRHKDGHLTGGIATTERTYINGVLTGTTTVKADADELIIIGNRAYVRAGTFYIVVVDNGEGAKADPDRSFALMRATPLPLISLVFTLNVFVDFAGIGADTIKGNAQVRG
jgi:hypothetical protein